MKKNDFIQIKDMEIRQLQQKVGGLKEELAGLEMDKNMRKLKDLRLYFKKRKDLAQVLTVLRQKQLLGELEGEAKQKEEKK